MVCGGGKTLPAWLDSEVFAGMEKKTRQPEEKGRQGFIEYMKHYITGLSAEKMLGGI